eukprot:g2819.t1
MPSAASVKVALVQLTVGTDKDANIRHAEEEVTKAADGGAELVVLPEVWNGPYDTNEFPKYSEVIPASADQIDAAKSPSVKMMSEVAKKKKIYLVGGSISERDAVCFRPKVVDADGNNVSKAQGVYNTSLVFAPDGSIVAKHRKMHLFDIDVPGGVTFFESDSLTAGDSVTTFDTPFGKCGLAICYDMRFPELAMLMREQGCKVLIYPGAFNTTTGPKHWELLARARAVDNQAFVLCCSPARNPDSKYQAWGHSQVIEPWGKVISTTEHDETTITATLDFELVDSFRTSIPLALQKRYDLYYPVKLRTDTQRAAVILGSALVGAVLAVVAVKQGLI